MRIGSHLVPLSICAHSTSAQAGQRPRPGSPIARVSTRVSTVGWKLRTDVHHHYEVFVTTAEIGTRVRKARTGPRLDTGAPFYGNWPR